MPAIGGTPSKLASASPRSNPVWSTDGTQLTLVVKDSTGLPGAEIYTLSTYERKRVALPGEQFERNYLSWSPSGDFFAYTDADNLYRVADISVIKILRIADGKSFQLENDDHLDFFPIWSLDGRILYFISDRGGTPDLWQVKISAKGKTGRQSAATLLRTRFGKPGFFFGSYKNSFLKRGKNRKLVAHSYS